MAVTIEYSDIAHQVGENSMTFNVGTCAEDDVIVVLAYYAGDQNAWSNSGRYPTYDGTYSGKYGSGYMSEFSLLQVNNNYTSVAGYIVCNSGDNGQSRTVTVSTVGEGGSSNYGAAGVVLRLRGVDLTDMLNNDANNGSVAGSTSTSQGVTWSTFSPESKAGLAISSTFWFAASPFTIASFAGSGWSIEEQSASGVNPSGASRDAQALVSKLSYGGSGSIANTSFTVSGTPNAASVHTRLLFNEIASAPSGYRSKVKIGGTFVEKPVKVKIAGTFVEKPIKVKVGGSFV